MGGQAGRSLHLEWVGAGESDTELFHYVERVDALSIRKHKIKALHQPRDSNGDKQHAECHPRALPPPCPEGDEPKIIPSDVDRGVVDEPLRVELERVGPVLGVSLDGVHVGEHARTSGKVVARDGGGLRGFVGQKQRRGSVEPQKSPSRLLASKACWGCQPRLPLAPCPPLRLARPAASACIPGVGVAL